MFTDLPFARGSQATIHRAVIKNGDGALKEYTAQRNCAHRNVCPVHLVQMPGAPAMIIMPAAAMDLLDYLQMHKSDIGTASAFRIARDMVTAILTIHSRAYVHRDIKLENVLLFDLDAPHGPTAKISDFGFAARLKRGEFLHDHIGSPTYVAPEILKRLPYNHKVDMWSLGVCIYTLATGSKPFCTSNTRTLAPHGLKRWRKAALSDHQRESVIRTLREDPAKRASSANIAMLRLQAPPPRPHAP